MSNKKHLKGAICVVMTLVLVVCAVMGVTASNSELAQTGASGSVYYKNNSNWGEVYCYMWNGGGETKNAEWPGVKMTNVKDNIWKYETSQNFDNVIFNNGSGGNGNQTGDLQFTQAGKLFNGSTWEDYVDDTPTSPTPTSPNPTDPTPTTPIVTDGKYVYCLNEASWGDVYCYMWKDGAGENATWPGKKMESIGNNEYRYEVTGSWNMVIFNSGSDANKTADMSFPGVNKIYNNSNGEWKDYDTSPISVKSFKTDADGTVYKNMELTLSANATSTGGTVYYKYSVTNGASTTTIKDFSTANSVKWTPTAAGTYTITFDFKDAANNVNQRTLTVSVLDDASVAAPIIKKVTPNTTQVKNNTNMNIAVTAGGGKVGTNLLFYKYTVQDASGKTLNVPYYTKNATYAYKPTSLGKFTVTVAVQNSQNETVERTFTFESVNTVTEPTEPTPPSPTNPVDPTGVLGDANNDGKLSILDATCIQRYLAKKITTSEIRLDLSDYDKNGEVNIKDATFIQRKLANLI